MASVVAEASATIDWLRSVPAIAIPVYQREYRWRPAACEHLLHDVRTVAAALPGRTHFIGSILATPEPSGAVTLVDGQQRVTTLMLMLAAVRAHAAAHDEGITRSIDEITQQPGSPGRTRLRPHDRYLDVVANLMSGAPARTGPTTFEDNYFYLYERLAGDWRSVWHGMQRLEHVTITLQPDASAQQIFESLNSTGAALSDDELIHNYLHMGRSHDEQLLLESDTWIPIEEAVGGQTRSFWRDYLVLTSPTQPDFGGDFGIYRAFRRSVPDPLTQLTDDVRAEWVRQAQRYGVLLDPAREPDPGMREQLDLLRAFEGAPRPLVLGVYGDYLDGHIDKPTTLATLEQIQTLFIRRNVVGLSRDIALAGSVCRELRADRRYPIEGLVRRTPEDRAVRLALTYSALPNAGYVLRRLQRPASLQDLQVEHIYPQNPRAGWTGGGPTWAELGNDEQARYRTLLNTIGNLTLLEAGLNAGASNLSFGDKAGYYTRSMVEPTKALAGRDTWDAASIEERTQTLIRAFLDVWPRPGDVPMDEPDDLTRVVDLSVPMSGNMADPARFEYAVFRGEVWGDVHNVKALHWRVAKALDALDPARLRATEYRENITATKKPNTKYATGQLGDGSYLYQAWATRYLLDVVQTSISAFALDDDLKVKLIELAEPTDQTVES